MLEAGASGVKARAAAKGEPWTLSQVLVFVVEWRPWTRGAGSVPRQGTRTGGREGRRRRTPVVRGRDARCNHPRPARRRTPRQPRPRAAARRRDVLQRQPPPEPHQRLRRLVRPVRLRREVRRHPRVDLHRGAGGRGRRARRHRGGHRVAHRGGPSPQARRRVLRSAVRRALGTLPLGAPQGADDGRDRLPGAAREAAGRGGGAAPGGGRPGFLPGRRRRDLRRARARRDLRPQDLGRALARDRAHRAHARPQVELHDAVRPRRDGRGAGRPPRAPARAAGRDGRVPVLHPARLPPGQHPSRRTSPRAPAGSTCRPWRSPA